MYVCVCAGRHCEIYKDPCLKVHCHNRGHCESAGLNSSCVCPPGYLGEHWYHYQLISATYKCHEYKDFFLTQPHLSTQAESVRSTSMSVRATLVTMEAPALTNQTATPVTVHPAGWDPAVKSVSQKNGI